VELIVARVSTIADYTIELSNFPTDIKLDENQVKDHITTVTGHEVAKVFIAYNNKRHIQLLQFRGKLIKQQAKLLKEYYHLYSLSRINQTSLEIFQEKLNKLSVEINVENTKLRKGNDTLVSHVNN